MTGAPAVPVVAALGAGEFTAAVPALGTLLARTVEAGASLGFLAPLDVRAAREWWRVRESAVADGRLLVWAAYDAYGIAGTISLAFAETGNGRHRGEILKLMVHPRARRRGTARTLLATAEEAAACAGTTLLMLDTETDSPAERLYLSAGWTRYGVVPDYATNPFGALRPCSFFYKRLLLRAAATTPAALPPDAAAEQAGVPAGRTPLTTPPKAARTDEVDGRRRRTT